VIVLESARLLAATTSGPSPLWYAARATGVVALLLLTITVALGVAGVSRLSSPRWPRVVTAGLHKNISLLVVAFVVVHVLASVLDTFVSISPAALIVPFVSSYRPFWLSLGTIAFDLILALVVTSLLRARIPYRAWRAVHWLAYASWPIALWHGLGTGTDAKLSWLLLLDAACILLVAGALLWRLTLLAPGRGRTAAMAAAVAVPIATIVFALVGPLQPGWAAKAGTPVALLGSSAKATAATGPAGPAPVALTRFTGRAATRSSGGQEVITVRARAGAGELTIVLRGTPDGSAISMSGGTVRLTPRAGGPTWTGPVTTLDGTPLAAALRGPGGAEQQAQLTLVIRGRQASGQVNLRPAVQP
jgi:sulfoxide reductase heme-binding subunit YedZ